MRTETVTQALQVCLGEHAIAVGTLTYSRQGAREIADTEPDGWGCKVIARDHANRRKAGRAGESVALTELDYLLGVDDIGRMGALRFRNAAGEFMRTPQENERGIPPLLELRRGRS